jgi:peptidyl-prolyl cis-trans isomerase C
MLKIARFAAFAMAGVFASGLAFADDKTVTVNGVTIPQERIDQRVKFAARQGQPDSPELRKMITEDLINLELMSQEATKKGLDKQPDTVQQIELAKESALASAWVQDYTKNHPISEDALKQQYDSLKAKLGPKEYKVAHILVKTEAEAKAIEAKLKKGYSFSKLAKQKSKDAGSAAHGGELGWNAPTNFVAPFAEALLTLKKGKISAPVESQFGWHIIKLEDVRNMKVPPFEQVKPNLMQRMQQEMVQKAISDLRAGAKIEE